MGRLSDKEVVEGMQYLLDTLGIQQWVVELEGKQLDIGRSAVVD